MPQPDAKRRSSIGIKQAPRKLFPAWTAIDKPDAAMPNIRIEKCGVAQVGCTLANTADSSRSTPAVSGSREAATAELPDCISNNRYGHQRP